ncbi:hypothetical protein BESB_084740 [Besnoitia besnoiti]|uniref:Uncharacterized protein n=1 Tax=Besnoitia besnoiti TaxID=94643 RepID=A0A2A9M5P0_BESBE|nr:hypothetical protein BESB_084740 [Besnoitia besnoiti]PFH33275.1 hypothetical protein BESB_084740 [Besnoitia besnoiti]
MRALVLCLVIAVATPQRDYYHFYAEATERQVDTEQYENVEPRE